MQHDNTLQPVAVDTLAARHADRRVTDVVGVRWPSGRLRARTGHRHRAKQRARAERQAAQDERIRNGYNHATRAMRERVQPIAFRDEKLGAAGLLNDHTPAAAVMLGADKASRLEAKGRVFDEMLAPANRGEAGTYTRPNPQSTRRSNGRLADRRPLDRRDLPRGSTNLDTDVERAKFRASVEETLVLRRHPRPRRLRVRTLPRTDCHDRAGLLELRCRLPGRRCDGAGSPRRGSIQSVKGVTPTTVFRSSSPTTTVL